MEEPCWADPHVVYEVSSSDHECVSMCTDLCIGSFHDALGYPSRAGECICEAGGVYSYPVLITCNLAGAKAGLMVLFDDTSETAE